MGDLATMMPERNDPPACEATSDSRAAAFIEARKDLQLEVALGRKILETYAIHMARVLARITLLFEQTKDGRAAEDVAIAEARTLAMRADALEAAARDWMDVHVRPIVDRHRSMSPPKDGNQALVQAWGNGFYALVRAEYDAITDCLDGIHAAADRSHDMRAAIVRCVIREVGGESVVEPAQESAA